MGASICIDPKDSRKQLYLDVNDYRRPRPRAMLPGCSLITIYQRRENIAAGEPEENICDQLMLAIRGWRLIDRIQEKAKR